MLFKDESMRKLLYNQSSLQHREYFVHSSIWELNTASWKLQSYIENMIVWSSLELALGS